MQLIPLREYYLTLPKKELLIGERVYHENNEQWVYIKSVDEGLWCGRNRDDDFGHFYNMDDLQIKK